MPSIADSELSRVVQRCGWELCPNLPYWMLIKTPGQAEAYYLLDRYGDLLGEWADLFTTFIGYANKVIQVPAMTNTINPLTLNQVLQFGGQMKVTMPLLRIFEQMLTSDTPGGLVRVHDQQQVCLNSANQGLLSVSTRKATSWKRHEYWYLPDLENFEREWRQRLEPDNPQSVLEFTYRSKDTPEHQTFDLRVTTRYRLIRSGEELYHYCEAAGMEEVSRA